MATQRLTSADFRAFRPKTRTHGSLFTLSVAPHENGPKWACVVPNRIAPKAATRNTIKRKCREVLRKEFLGSKEQQAFVFNAKREAATATLSDVAYDIRALLGRVGFRGTIPRT